MYSDSNQFSVSVKNFLCTTNVFVLSLRGYWQVPRIIVALNCPSTTWWVWWDLTAWADRPAKVNSLVSSGVNCRGLHFHTRSTKSICHSGETILPRCMVYPF